MKLMEDKTWLWVGLVAGGVSALISLTGLIPGLNCLMCPVYCVSWFIVPMTTGFLTVYLSKIKRSNMQEALVKSALAGVVLGLIGGIVSIILQMFSTLFNLSYQSSLDTLQNRNDRIENLVAVPAGMLGTLMCGSVFCLAGTLIDVFFSAIGGIIGTALSKE